MLHVVNVPAEASQGEQAVPDIKEQDGVGHQGHSTLEYIHLLNVSDRL